LLNFHRAPSFGRDFNNARYLAEYFGRFGVQLSSPMLPCPWAEKSEND